MLTGTSTAGAVASAELYTAESYSYGRFEARVQFALGDGVVSSFFLWKDGSEMQDVFWNELDFEKLGADCHLETNALYGLPEMTHSQRHEENTTLCSSFHTYAYEWTPEYIAWSIDGVEIRRETGEAALAFADNAAQGIQVRFNIWPGDSSFGGNFDPAILPVHQYVNWVQFSAYVDGAFEFQWREDFASTTQPPGWLTGSWGSPKNLSTHVPANVSFIDGYAVLSLTADDAMGSTGAMPLDVDDSGTAPSPSSPVIAPSGEPSPPGTGRASPADAAGTGSTSGMAEPAEGCGCRVAAPSKRTELIWVLGFGVLVWSGRRWHASRAKPRLDAPAPFRV